MRTLLALLAASVGASPAALVDVYAGGEEGYACYRIPALLRVATGGLFAFAEARKYGCGDHGYVDLVVKRSDDGGASWGPLTLVHSESSVRANVTIGNPAPLQLSNGSVMLPFCRNNMDVGLLRSDDGGVTWGAPVYIAFPNTSQLTWVATGPPGSLQLPSGRIILPLDYSYSDTTDTIATTLYSDDGGGTWTLPGSGIAGGNECQAVALPWRSANTLQLSARSARGQARLQAESLDGGATWGSAWLTVNETECEASVASLLGHPGAPMLAMSTALNAAARMNMTLMTSPDGRAWTPAAQVYPGAAAYSSLVAINNTAVALLFEKDSYTTIAFTTVTLL